MADYATLEDFKVHWSGLPSDREADAQQKLHEASVKVRALFPDVDRRIISGDLDAEVPRLVVNGMVKRAMDGPAIDGMSGVGSATQQTGPFSQTFNFTNPDGAIYLSKEDKRMLSGRRTSGRAFTVRPGW